MSAQPGFEKCLSFINCQLQPEHRKRATANGELQCRAVTISRQTGCGALIVGQKLAEYLQARAPGLERPWMVFDRDLVEKVLEDHHLPKRLAQFMREDRVSEISDTLEDLFGVHPPSWTLVRQTAETVLHLAELGNVILIGRGANVITGKLDSVFHVRLVGSLEKRLERIQQFEHLDRKTALDFIHREDRGRARYLKKHFHKDIADLLLYHLTLNTDLVSCEQAAKIIGDAALSGD